jgi:hypothetical protein
MLLEDEADFDYKSGVFLFSLSPFFLSFDLLVLHIYIETNNVIVVVVIIIISTPAITR